MEGFPNSYAYNASLVRNGTQHQHGHLIDPSLARGSDLASPTTDVRGNDPLQAARDGDSEDAGDGPSDAAWERMYRYSAEGVAEERAKWQAEYAHLSMAPPPPEIYASKDAAIADQKAFAQDHGYRLVIAHSYKSKKGELNRILLTCEYAGEYKNHHKLTPESRIRNRASRKTNCPFKIRLQKKRFSEEWVSFVNCATHNHASNRTLPPPQTSTLPELESALYDWHVMQLSQGEPVHGNTLKAKALALFAEMPQYRGDKPPDFSRTWLDQYRIRHKLPGKVYRPSGPPPIIDPSTAQEPATAATTPAAINQPTASSKEWLTFSGMYGIFDDRATFDGVKGFVKDYMSRYDASHDWNHIMRVFALARRILHEEMQREDAPQYDPQVVLLAALLHDVGDHKYAKQGENSENQIAEVLLEHGSSTEAAMKIQLICKNVSFSNEIKNPRMMKAVMDQHPELAIVQDADRLDAIGAVGIGRTFTYNGAKQSDEGMQGVLKHFTDKLERLEQMMKTTTGKSMAKERTIRLRTFRQWFAEEDTLAS